MQTCSNDLLEINPDFFIYLALLLIIMPFRLVLAWLVASGIHELCHYIPLRFFRIRVIRFTLGYHGAVMHTEPMLPWQEFISVLCGPAGGVLLLVFCRWIPLVAACGIIQSVFNLLPFYPLDGGRLIRLLMDMLNIPRKYRSALSNIKKVVLLIAAGTVVYFCRHTVLLIYALLYLIIRLFRFFFLQTRQTDSKMVGI